MSRQRRAVFSCLFSLLLLITLAPPAVLKRIRKGPQSLIGDQKRALKVVKSGHNLFLTGAAGTGKSHVLRYLNKTLVRLHGKGTVYVTASTGVAGQSINGTTLHSFARIGFGKGKPKIHNSIRSGNVPVR
jgi:ATP-dependent DNA helicase PIF1